MKGYEAAQSKFIKEKTAALKVIERELDLETSLQDHKQVTVDTCIAGIIEDIELVQKCIRLT